MWLLSLALITGSVLLKVSQLSGSCLAPRGLLQAPCPWRGAGAVGCRALLFQGSSWLFARSLFSLCFFSRRTTSAHGVNLGSLKSFLKSQGNVLLPQAFAGVIPTCFVLFLFLGKRQCHLLPFFFFFSSGQFVACHHGSAARNRQISWCCVSVLAEAGGERGDLKQQEKALERLSSWHM